MRVQMGEQVISSVKKSKEFAIQLDETTDVSSNSQLMVYIRYRGSDEFEEEMLLCSPLELRTRGIDVFNKVDACFKKPNVDLKWEDCIAVSVDGAPAMLGHVNGFVALAKQQNPDILAIHSDIFGHVNELNKELQGKKVNLLLAREKISAFVSKLQYWNQKVNVNKTAAFPKLGEFLEECQDCSLSDIKESVTRHLTKLRNRFCDYFPELDSHTVSWFVNPFKSELADLPEKPEGLAEKLIELRSNNETKMEFESKDDLSSFWMSKTAHMEATKMLLPFATTYVCEQGFSTLVNLKTKYRNRLNPEDSILVAVT
ncbi:protein FAM200C-like [Oratosquilla oratoria]|uniref:protein FAM200C-like n=1 Tax=Oratosquilla oratoria TaxID=337810 RepID=UPI003F76F3C4